MILASKPIPAFRRRCRDRIAVPALTALAVLVLSAPIVRAQFSTVVELVEVYASVTAEDGRPVDSLTVADFVLTEDGRPRSIDTFARGDFPLSVILALDRSFSMAGAPLRQARSAARTFVDALRPEDEALIVAVGSAVEPLGELSRDRAQQQAALESLTPWGTTSLHDAIVNLIDRVSVGRGRRALVLLSDGRDRYSRATAEEVLARARRTDVLIYGITLGPGDAPLFGQLAALTGGRAEHVTRPEDLGGVLDRIQRELRTQYLLGYTPPDGPAGWRSIEVSANVPGLRVRARAGYVAP